MPVFITILLLPIIIPVALAAFILSIALTIIVTILSLGWYVLTLPVKVVMAMFGKRVHWNPIGSFIKQEMKEHKEFEERIEKKHKERVVRQNKAEANFDKRRKAMEEQFSNFEKAFNM